MATVSEHLRKLLADPRFTDVVVVACSPSEQGEEQKEIPANSLMLERSPVFSRMLEHGSTAGCPRRLEVKCVSPRSIETLVLYLHTDGFSFPESWNLDLSLELLEHLQRFELPLAVQAAMPELQRQLSRASTQRCLEVLDRAGKVELPAGCLEAVADRACQSATFGTGQVMQVVAWTLSGGPLETVLTERMRKGALRRVSKNFGHLKAELAAAEPQEPARLAGQALILTTYLQSLAPQGTYCGTHHYCKRKLKGGVDCGQGLVCSNRLEPPDGLHETTTMLASNLSNLLSTCQLVPVQRSSSPLRGVKRSREADATEQI